MRFLTLFFAFVVGALLASCGGGGGSAGTTPGNSTSLFTTAPSSVNLTLGNAQKFTVGGGKGPYTAVSSDISVAAAGIAGSDLTLGAVTPGSATITIRDSVGATTSVSVTAKPIKALFTTSPSAVTIAIGNSNAQTFQVSGGVAPYVVGNSNASVLSATISGENLTFTGLAPGSANVVILDAVGGSLNIAVTVPSVATLDLFTTASPAVTIPNGTTASYVIGGGSPPYSATSANTAIATASVSGTTLTFTAGNTGSTSVSVRDSGGRTVGVSVTISPTQAFFTTAPSSITVPMTQSVSYSFGGGVGPYSVTSSNNSVSTASISGTTLTINGIANGSANIQLRDSAGTVLPIGVTVPAPIALFTTASPSITLPLGTTVDYTIGGGIGPYTVSSNNITVTNATVTGAGGKTLRISALAIGNGTLTVRDSVGGSATAAVTVTATSAFFTTAPSAITLGIGSTQTYTVGGGVSPYTAVSNNTGVATVTTDGTSSVSITGVAAGTAQITLRDSVGATATVAVTVSGGTSTPLTVTAAPGVTLAVGSGPSNYTVSGGTSPYTAQSSNTLVASASVVGTTLTIVPNAQGSAVVTVRDSAANSVTVAVTVQPSQAFFTTAPSAVTVAVGTPVTYALGGGVAGYTVTSSNTAVVTVAPAALAAAGNFTITAVKAGSANVVLRDNAGTTITLGVTVPAGTALFTTAPSSVTLAVGAAAAQSYSVGGGTGPYTLTSSNTAVATVSPGSLATAGAFTITGKAVGTANIQVLDNAGATVTISVAVVNAQMSLNPSSANTFVGTTNYAYIIGGSPPYTALSGFPSVATVSIGTLAGSVFTPNPSGNVLRMIANQAASPDQIVVTDNAGNSVNFALTISAGTLQEALVPTDMTVSACVGGAGAAGDITLLLYGATGTVNLFSSDTSLITTPVSVVGGGANPTAVTVHKTTKGAGGGASVIITGIDSTGASAQSTITIVTPVGACP
jgi:hypothetical protein